MCFGRFEGDCVESTKRFVTIACLAAWLCLHPFFRASADPLGLITGVPKGTAYQVGLDMQELMKSQGIDLEVFSSAGSVENIYAVYKRAGVQLGIVQSDVLAFVTKVSMNPTLKRIAQKIKVVFPLYDEEIHLLGKQSLRTFEDLEGKRIAIDKEDSGTYLTAKLLCEVAQVKPAQILALGPEEALERLKDGTLDALFYVAGWPVKLFQENVKSDDQVHLVPIVHKKVLKFYPQAVIPAGTYKWQQHDVSTAAVKAVLITYDYRMGQCQEVGRFARILYEHQPWLKAHGHPKWKQLNLSYEVKGWEMSPCVQKELRSPAARDVPETMEVNPIVKAIQDLL